MASKNKLLYLFLKMRKKLIDSDKFKSLSNKINEQVKKSYFFDNSKVICVYNGRNSVPLNSILLDSKNYFKNIFVFPQLIGNKLSFFHISGPDDIVINELGTKKVRQSCFKVDINEIDVILVPGVAFDYTHNWLNEGDNVGLYDVILSKTDATKLGVCFNCQVYGKNLPESKNKLDGLLTEEGVLYYFNI